MLRLFRTHTVRTFLIAFFSVGLLFSHSARAVSTSTDYTGLWWNSAESGWGMNVIQQEQIIFITLFIYGTGNTPTWYVGPATNFTTANAAGDRTYTGRLYATTGTPFAVTPFVPGSVGVTDVGSVTFVGKADGTATLQYNVGATTVNKTLVRQTWAQPNNPTPNVAVRYVTSTFSTTAGCANPADNGAGSSSYGAIDDGSRFAITITPSNALTMEIVPPRTSGLGTCTFIGPYTQEGRYGKATLTGRCSTQPSTWTNITWNIRELEIGQNFFNAQFTNSGGVSASCTERGAAAGVKIN